MSEGSLIETQAGLTAGPPAWLVRLFAWIQARQRAIITAAIALQIAVLLTMIALHASPYVFGQSILLKVVPIDPRDMFRGDYVVLGYEIGRIPPGGIAGLPDSAFWWSRRRSWNRDAGLDERAVYVTLEPAPDGRHWQATNASTERPASGKFIRGKYTPLGLRFGIEAFYVQEGTGLELERLRNSQQLSAEVALAPWGQAKLIRLVTQ